MSNLFTKVREFVFSASYKRTLTVLGVFVLLAAVPLTVYIAQQQQDVRQRASGTCLQDCTTQFDSCKVPCAVNYGSCDANYNSCIAQCSPDDASCTNGCSGVRDTCKFNEDNRSQHCNTNCTNTRNACIQACPVFGCNGTQNLDGGDPEEYECQNAPIGGSNACQTGWTVSSQNPNSCTDQGKFCCWKPAGTSTPPGDTQPPGEPGTGSPGTATCNPFSPDFLRNECTGCNTSNSVCQDSNGFRTSPNANDTACASWCTSQPPPPPPPVNPPVGGATVACQNNPPSTNAPAGFSWIAKCNVSCSDSTIVNPPDCASVRNTFDPSNIDPNNSTWCYPFTGGNRCLQYVRNACQTGSEPACFAIPPTATPGPGQCQASSQTPDNGDACVSCIANAVPSLVNDIKSLNPGGLNTCNNKQLINMWCNGGIGQEAAAQCTGLKNGTCASSCGGGTQPTPTPTTTGPTATPAPGDKLFAFNLALDGILAGRTIQTPQRQLSVELIDSAGQVTTTKTGAITYNNGSGKFAGTVNMGNISTGSYQVKVKTGRYLKRRIPGITTITATTTQVTMPETSLIVGDMKDDNKVDIQDYNVLVGCFGPKSTTALCTNKTNADLDDNNVVDEVDYNIFVRSLAVQTGD